MRKREVTFVRSAQEAAIRDLVEARYLWEQLYEEILPSKVWEARRAGVTWGEIGRVMGGVSGQAALQRFARVQVKRMAEGDFPIGYEGPVWRDDDGDDEAG